MSHTHPHEAHHVKKGQYIMLKGKPCKITDCKTSKTGKHGHAKCNITGTDVLDGRKCNEVHPGHIVLMAFDLDKKELEVTNINAKEEEVSLMDEEGNILPNDEGYFDFMAPADVIGPDGQMFSHGICSA